MSRSAQEIVATVLTAIAVGIAPSSAAPVVEELATFAAPGCVGDCGSGGTIGPDKALYVTDGPGGRVLRVDPAFVITLTGKVIRIDDAGRSPHVAH